MNIKAVVLVVTIVAVSIISVPKSVDAKDTVEEAVREYFKDIPVMIEIARCESKFRQHTADGSVLRGGFKGGMVGVFQVYESVHTKAANALGLDIETLEGNLGYAKHLYNESGTKPWNSAKGCWGTSVAAYSTPLVSYSDTSELLERIEVLKKIIVQLQILLEEKQKVEKREVATI